MSSKVKVKSKLKSFFNRQVHELSKVVEIKGKTPNDCLISIKFGDNSFHHLIPENPEEFIEDLIVLEDIDICGDEFEDEDKKEIDKSPVLFVNKQAIGDSLMATCAARDFAKQFPDWKFNFKTTAPRIWDNNPYLDRSLDEKNAKVVKVGPGYMTNASNRDDRHFANAYRISIERELGIHIKQGEIKPDIWMTQEEISSPPLVEPPYWIITAGEKGDWTSKTYPFEWWQQVVEELDWIKFVQIGAREHVHQTLEGDNVVNFIGKTQDPETGMRDLLRLFYNAEGSVGLVTFSMHLAAAFNLPCVVIAGAREPARFTKYPGHQYLSTDGCLPCAETKACWSCDIDKTCKDVVKLGKEEQIKLPKCVALIEPPEIIRAIENYYEGGRLSKKEPRKPVVPNDPKKAIQTFTKVIRLNNDPITIGDFNPKTFGMEWGGSQITDKDCAFVIDVIKKYDVDNILEFGSGISTLVLSDRVSQVTTFETRDQEIDDIKPLIPDNVDMNIWDGENKPTKLINAKFDLVFVNGPPGGKNRELSVKIASEVSDVVIVHDGGRNWEQQWQDKYLKEKFKLIQKGGHRCHLWAKEGVHVTSKSLIKNADGSEEVHGVIVKRAPGKKLFRMVFNGRGDGGAERSTTWIMNKFIEMGWHVEYVAPQGTSGAFGRLGHGDISAVTDLASGNVLDALNSPCDILMLYTNDWVWEFPKELFKRAFRAPQAHRKVMAVNFRLGKIGNISWTKGWDQYIFLNSSLLDNFVSRGNDGVNCSAMAPPIDLSEFLKKEVDLSGSLKLIRHSSQGDTKFDKENFEHEVEAILERFPEAEIHLMPGPSFVEPTDRIIKYKRNDPPVVDFLTQGNVFWYRLPEGYHDMGPKVIMEAQAVGLPIIADNHSGPKDRVNKFCGFLCDTFEEHMEAIEKLQNISTRKRLGRNAKQHAEETYNPELWIKAIMGD